MATKGSSAKGNASATPPEQKSQQGPSAITSESDEITKLRLEVTGVHSFQRGLMAFLTLVGVFAGVVIAALGWLGFSNTIDRFVEDSVETSLDTRINQVQGDLQDAVHDADSASSTAESASSSAYTYGQQSISSAATAQAAYASMAILATQIAIDTGKAEWIVGVAAPPTLQEAQTEVIRLISAGITPSIYYIDDLFVVSIGSFENEDSANTARLAFQSAMHRSSTQLFNLSISCPYRRFSDAGFYICSVQPLATSTP